jgi:hypothetical protein
MAQLPIARGLILCEQMIVDQNTRNVSLINCTSRWPVAHFPTRPQRFFVYSALTNGLGDYRTELRITNLADDAVIYRRRGKCRFSHPLGVLRFSLHVKECIFSEEGRYSVQILANDELIADMVLLVEISETLR